MMKLLKKILFPSETDERVRSINRESTEMLNNAEEKARRHNELLKRNGVTLRIYIATGGDHRGH